jgi:glutamine amidotransferase
MIAIIDCGDEVAASPLQAAFAQIGADARPARCLHDLARASHLIIPDGPSFARMVRHVRDRGFVAPILKTIDQGRPVLGIARGMHLLFDVSYEEGRHTGLGALRGKVVGFDAADSALTAAAAAPHRGCADVRFMTRCPLFAALPTVASFCFDHAFYAEPLDDRFVAARCRHDPEFAAAVWRGPVIGVEFLPERSGDAGLRVLENFARQ